jgi:hypothetical protein
MHEAFTAKVLSSASDRQTKYDPLSNPILTVPFSSQERHKHLREKHRGRYGTLQTPSTYSNDLQIHLRVLCKIREASHLKFNTKFKHYA